jgi:DNA-binding transcriptional regulator YhcF (GntR family)
MIIRIDTDSPVPAFEQIRSEIAAMAGSGVLAIGARLPTIRQLARDLGIAPGTVARAYQELERQGVLVTRGRHGSFVSDKTAISGSEADLNQATEALAIKGYQLGLTADQLVDRLREVFPAIPEQG